MIFSYSAGMTDENTTPETTTVTPQKTKFKFTYISRSKCKRLALEMAKALRPANKFSRVSEDFLISCEVAVKNHIQSRVRCHPSNGKTLQ